MKDYFLDTLFSLGQACVNKKEWRTQRVVTFLNVVDLFIIPGP